MKAKSHTFCYLSEIFPSIQGEGLYAGTPQIFIRFAGCNLKCVWCDTPESLSKTDTVKVFYDLEAKEVRQSKNPIDKKKFLHILGEVIKRNRSVQIVGLTGGEALLQADFLLEVLPLVREKYKKPILLETSGTLVENLKKVSRFVDILSVDLKLPSSTKEKIFWQTYENLFDYIKQKLSTRHVYFKMVVTEETLLEDVKSCVNLLAKKIGGTFPIFIQPVTPFNRQKPPSISRLFDIFAVVRKKINNVKILPQIHPFMRLK